MKDRTNAAALGRTLTVALYVVLIGLIALGWALGGWPVARYAILPYLLFTVGDLVSTIFHEAGHAIVARALGMRVVGVDIGTGAFFLRFRVGSIPVRIGAVLGGGFTRMELPDTTTGYRSRQIAVLLAGPAAHLGSIVVMWPFVQQYGLFDLPRFWLYGAIFGLVVQLLPVRIRDTGTDGYQALRFLLAGDEEVEEMTALAADAARVRATLERHAVAINSAHDRDELGAARAELEEHLASDPPEQTAALSKNNLACVLLGLGDSDLRLTAIQLAEEANAVVPDEPAFRSTLGAALVGVGRYAEAMPLLVETAGDDPGGFTNGHLALAAIKEDRLDIARRAAAHAATAGFRGWPLVQATPLIGREETRLLITNFGAGTSPVEAVVADVRDVGGPLASSIGRASLAWLTHARADAVDQMVGDRDVEAVKACARALADGASGRSHNS